MTVYVLILACTRGEPSVDIPSLPTTPVSENWVSITTYPCAQWRDGHVHCWYDPERMSVEMPDSPWPVEAFYAHWNNGLGVRQGGVLEPWYCTQPWGGSCPRPWDVEVPMVQLSYTSGLLPDGRRYPFNSAPTVRDGMRYTTLKGDSQELLLSVENVLYLEGGLSTSFEQDLGDREVRDIAGAGELGCALFETGEIECYGEEIDYRFPEHVAVFDEPPYRMIAGGIMNICAVREDWEIVCDNGRHFNFGPLRDLAVSTYSRIRRVDGELDPRPIDPARDLAVCVITQADTLHCAGNRYSRALNERLGIRELEDTGVHTEGWSE